jgi:hypothetical protein
MMTKSSSQGWAYDVAPVEAMRNSHKILAGKPEAKKIFEDLSADGRIILKWVHTGTGSQPLPFAAFPIHHSLTS